MALSGRTDGQKIFAHVLPNVTGIPVILVNYKFCISSPQAFDGSKAALKTSFIADNSPTSQPLEGS